MQINKTKLVEAMEVAGVSRYHAFDRLGISEPTWYRWQRDGFPTMAILALCHILRVEEEAITDGE